MRTPLLHRAARASGTNLIANGGFEIDTSGWSVAGGGTFARITGISGITPKFGAAFGVLVAATAETVQHAITVPRAGRYILSTWVTLFDANDSISGVDIQTSGFTGSSVVDDSKASADMTVADTVWQRLWIVVDIAASDLSGQLEIAVSGTPSAFDRTAIDGVRAASRENW